MTGWKTRYDPNAIIFHAQSNDRRQAHKAQMDHGAGVKSLVNEWQVSGLITNWITAMLSPQLSIRAIVRGKGNQRREGNSFSPASDPALWSHTRTVGHPAASAIATSCPRSWSRARLATRWVAAWPDPSYAHCMCHTAWPNYDADTRPPVCSIPRRHFDRRSRSPLSRHVAPHWRAADRVLHHFRFRRWHRPPVGCSAVAELQRGNQRISKVIEGDCYLA